METLASLSVRVVSVLADRKCCAASFHQECGRTLPNRGRICFFSAFADGGSVCFPLIDLN